LFIAWNGYSISKSKRLGGNLFTSQPFSFVLKIQPMALFQPIYLVHLAFGPLILLVAWIFKKNPPKRINAFYGYRTSTSMKSQAAWEEANRFSANVMIWMAGAAILYQLVTQVFFGFIVSFPTSGVFLAITQLATIPITELHLKSIFDQAGRRK